MKKGIQVLFVLSLLWMFVPTASAQSTNFGKKKYTNNKVPKRGRFYGQKQKKHKPLEQFGGVKATSQKKSILKRRDWDWDNFWTVLIELAIGILLVVLEVYFPGVYGVLMAIAIIAVVYLMISGVGWLFGQMFS